MHGGLPHTSDQNEIISLVIRQRSVVAKASSGSSNLLAKLARAGIDAKLRTPRDAYAAPRKKVISPAARNQVVEVDMTRLELHRWDLAHRVADAAGSSAAYVEPDKDHAFAVHELSGAPIKRKKKSPLVTAPVDPDWPPGFNEVWHLDDQHAQLGSARAAVLAMTHPVYLAHLDTGYSTYHPVIADTIRTEPLQRNFVDGEDLADAHDPLDAGMLKQPGHGTGTLGILAGSKVSLPTQSGGFDNYLGAAPFATIIPCRIAASVVLFKTSAFADALNYLTALTLSGTPVQVASMSMGGAPSQIWVDAVNAAYEAGILLVSAAGNHFNGFPTRRVVYPARFKRVTAACGVTYDFKPYFTRKPGEMQGCFGPKRYMEKAIAAFTPNIPWASVRTGGIDFSGAGTSAATPQVAAAAAIYYRKYHKELDAMKPWQRLESIRHALFLAARKHSGHAEYDRDFSYYFGQGILQANDALQIPVLRRPRKTAPDEMPWFPILTTLFKAAPTARTGKKLTMYNTELAQLVYDQPALASLLDEDKPYEKIGRKVWKDFRDAVIAHPDTSLTLKTYLRGNR